MTLETLTVGPLQSNCYLFGDETGEAIVIDPGDEGERIMQRILELGLRIRYIVNTHGHFDHICAVDHVRRATKAKFLIHREEAELLSQAKSRATLFLGLDIPDPPVADAYLDDGQVISFGSTSVKVIHTPGHTPGGICLLSARTLFSGDTLFAGSVGRTDLPGSSWDLLAKSIRERLLPLEDDIQVYPGHGASTTIGYERHFNPFIPMLLKS